MEALSAYMEDIYTCNRTRCGFCREECPVYRIKRYETFSCRGKMLVARGLMEGMVEASREVAWVAETCLLCGYCQARCALRNIEILMAMRQWMTNHGLTSPAHRENVKRILKEGRLFESKVLAKRDGRTPIYIGCLYRSRAKELLTIFSVLEKLGLDPQFGEETCCGYLLEATGFSEEFEEIRGRCLEDLGPRRKDRLLTLCPTCTKTLKERYGLPVEHAIVIVHQKLREPEMARKLRPLNLRATYHDPCHLGRMLGILEEPREILQRCGVDVIEMEHNRYFSTCCGGGGGLRAVDDFLSIEISKNRIREALAVGAEMVLTVCPTCESTLLRASGRLVNEIENFVEVRSLWDILDGSLSR